MVSSNASTRSHMPPCALPLKVLSAAPRQAYKSAPADAATRAAKVDAFSSCSAESTRAWSTFLRFAAERGAFEARSNSRNNGSCQRERTSAPGRGATRAREPASASMRERGRAPLGPWLRADRRPRAPGRPDISAILGQRGATLSSSGRGTLASHAKSRDRARRARSRSSSSGKLPVQSSSATRSKLTF